MSPGARSSVPELPEVETIVRELAPRLEGFRIARVQLNKTDVLRRVSKARLIRTLRGNTIEQITRRAKHAVFRLSSGHRMIIQPRMTGSLVAHERPLPLTRDQAKYAVLICTLNDGRRFVYRDVRRLGTIWLLDEKGWKAYTGRIGPEPLEETFTPFVFADRLKGTRTAVKKAIMDQRRLAGVETSMPTRRCSTPGSTRRSRQTSCRSRNSRACTGRSWTCCSARWHRRGRRCGTIARERASVGDFSSSCESMAAAARSACSAARA